MQTNGHPLDALGDPTRRQIFELRARGRVRSVTSRPGSREPPRGLQHLRVLEDVGLVTHHRSGTRNLYELDSAGVETLRDWVDGFWSEALARFKYVAEKASRRGGSS